MLLLPTHEGEPVRVFLAEHLVAIDEYIDILRGKRFNVKDCRNCTSDGVVLNLPIVDHCIQKLEDGLHL